MDRTALICAQLCKTAYDSGIRVGGHSFAVSSDGRVIAIAGTQNFENVLEDVDVLPASSPGGYLVHGGVMDTFYELNDAISPYIKPGVLISGHSLGGGSAQMFAEKYGLDVITFGSLAVYFTCDTPKLNHSRYVHHNDPVPSVPLWPYRHACNAIRLGPPQDGKCVEDHFIEAYIKELSK